MVDAAVPATGMLALELIDELGLPLTADIAFACTPRSAPTPVPSVPRHHCEAMRVAARLMETGIDFAGIARTMFDTRSRWDSSRCRPAINSLDLMRLVDAGSRWRIGIAWSASATERGVHRGGEPDRRRPHGRKRTSRSS
ncbi:MAG: hypothetical protein H6524_05440 [Actinobacteria bacterium]|nr:hypothetical protein [Actinomycetota bacterium]